MIEKKFLETIRQKNLLSPGDPVLLAVSGGPDSVAMLRLFYRFQKKLKIKLHLAHFNHQLRGQASNADEKFVRNLAQKLKVPAFFGRADVGKFARGEKISLEEAGRILRYQFFQKTAQKIGRAKIVTAHTADDQAETFLLRVLRGAGPAGLRGILFSRADKVIRPLLNITRDEIEKYLKTNRLKFRQDKTNLEPKFLRNYLRLKVMPLLKKINPGFGKNLSRNLEILQEEENWLGDLIKKETQRLSRLVNGEVKLNLKKFKTRPIALARRILRNILKQFLKSKKEISSIHINEILGQIKSNKKSWQLHLPGPVFVFGGRDFLIFSRREPELKKVEFCRPVCLGRKNFIPEINQTITLKVTDKIPAALLMRKLSPETIFLDFGKTGQKLFIRSRRAGDRFQPLGQKKLLKLKNFLINRKIPAGEKEFFPLLVNKKGEIVAVIGVEISEYFKLAPKTREILKVSLGSLS